MRRIAFVLTLVILLSCLAPAQEPPYLYRASLVQAAPGKLVDLIDLYRAHAGQQAPLWMRHSQGDRWDLLILMPMGSYAEYFRPESIAARAKQDGGWEARRKALVAWEEDVFVWGPPE